MRAMIMMSAAVVGQSAAVPAVPLYDGLGKVHFPITTSNPQAQRYFDQGLGLRLWLQPRRRDRRLPRGAAARSGLRALLLGRSFRLRAQHQRADGPGGQCPRGGLDAICQLAGAHGHARGARAHRGDAQALFARSRARTEPRSTPPMPTRCSPPPAHIRQSDTIALIAAESAMDTRPWDYWTTDKKPNPRIGEAVQLVETVLARNARASAGLAPLHPFDGERPRPEKGRSGRRQARHAARANGRPPRPHAGAYLLSARALEGFDPRQHRRRPQPTRPMSRRAVTTASTATAIIRTMCTSSSPRRRWPATCRPRSVRRGG